MCRRPLNERFFSSISSELIQRHACRLMRGGRACSSRANGGRHAPDVHRQGDTWAPSDQHYLMTAHRVGFSNAPFFFPMAPRTLKNKAPATLHWPR